MFLNKQPSKVAFLLIIFLIIMSLWLFDPFEFDKYQSFSLKLEKGSKIGKLSYIENCKKLYKKLRYPNQSLFFNPPLAEIPKEMYNDFTQNGEMPVKRNYYFNDRYPDSNGNQNGQVQLIPNTHMDALLKRVRDNEPLGYGDKNLNQLMTSYKPVIRNKSMVVVGTVNPWVEAIALNLEASQITTLEYNHKKYELTNMKWWHVNDYYDYALEKQLFEHFDNAASFSSIEHSGLGRFGDPLSPYGDVDAVKQVHCMLKPGGLFFFAVPTSSDDSSYIEFNAHRVYGHARLKLIFQGWQLIDKKLETLGAQTIFVMSKKNNFLLIII